MKEQIQKLKLELKSLAKQIKEKKSHRKDRMPDGTAGCGYVEGLASSSHTYRHKHIAYCLARGRTMEQIENKNVENNKPDTKFVQYVLDSMKPESTIKLYVVVRDDLSTSQKAVQSGHAVAQFLKEHPSTMWENGTLIYLKVKNLQELNYASSIQYRSGIEFSCFKEPDLNNEMTAIASYGYNADQFHKSYKPL